MKNKNIVLNFTVFTVILISVFFQIPVSALADGERETYTFRFENCTVADALKEISLKSGINIISNSIITKEILSKSYTDKNLDKIISDLLRGENCAVVWNYNNGTLDSIGLYTYNDKDSKGISAGTRRTGSSPANRTTVSSSSRRSSASRSARTFNELNNTRSGSNNTGTGSNNRINNRLPNYRTSDNKNTSERVNTKRNSASGTSRYTANKRKTTENTTGSSSDESEDVAVEEETSSTPPEPAPEKYNGLEPPPMPPGM